MGSMKGLEGGKLGRDIGRWGGMEGRWGGVGKAVRRNWHATVYLWSKEGEDERCPSNFLPKLDHILPSFLKPFFSHNSQTHTEL